MMLESSSENSDRMIRDRQGREYRLQVNGDGDSYSLFQKDEVCQDMLEPLQCKAFQVKICTS
jgi:hypothetical protein